MADIVDLDICITCFNKEKFLGECVDSVFRQTKLPKSIVVVHDGCDEPMAHAKAVSIILPSNVGVAKARQEAFRFSDGKLVLFLDGDDILSPDYIEKSVVTIAEGADVAYPDVYFFGDVPPSLANVPVEMNADFVKKTGKTVIPVTCVMKREVYLNVGGFRELRVLEDVDFWIRALCHGYTFKKADTLLWYRQSAESRNNIEAAKRSGILKEILSQFEFGENKVWIKKP